jgi:hypothetical protein
MKIFLKFALQVPLLVLVIAGAESYFPNWDPVGIFGLAFLLVLAYTTADYVGED